ncbi:MAG: hypothetical protein H0W76_07975 [Pyrinomonadaceae bacterium]|nr:hypothetical protein [Pyrinomonadaceae bacterium]
MNHETLEKIEQLIPLIVNWEEQWEKFILQYGIPLSDELKEDAAYIGVTHVDQVRLLQVPSIPMPTDPMIINIFLTIENYHLDAHASCLRYGIFIRADCSNIRFRITHELTHTAQCEQWGGPEPFCREYLRQLFTLGYEEMPFEQEANTFAHFTCIRRGETLPKPDELVNSVGNTMRTLRQ